jgi:hypothetical protein
MRGGSILRLLAVAASRARTAAGGFGLLLACGAHAFPSDPYFPLPDGATWTYSYSSPQAGTWTQTDTVVGSGAFNGSTVKIVRDNFGNETYYTNDAQGVRLHGQLFPGEETDTYTPPVPLAAQDATIGAAINGAGTVIVQIGVDGFGVSYSSTATPVGFENVTVPAGTFASALRVQVVINYSFGEVNWYQSTEVWLAPGIGIVKHTLFDSFDGYTENAELVSYNIPDTVPDAFSFEPRSVQAGSTEVLSDPITVTGITAAAPISITGGEYRINGGSFVASGGTVNNNDQVTVRVISAMPGFSTSATLNIGGVTASFMVTTLADTAPDAFTFTPVIGAPLGVALNSNRITVTGINAPTPISIVGGEYAMPGQPFTTAPGTVSPFATVDVRATSSASHGTTTKATLTIGGASADFSITTLVPGAAPFSALYFVSPPGDYIGDGRNRLINLGGAHPGTSIEVVRNPDGAFTVSITEPGGWYFLDLEAPGNGGLVPGRYEGASRYPFNGDAAGLTFSGNGRGCNTLTGRFDMLEIGYAADGTVQRLAANFEQHCEGFMPALFGQIRVNSTVPLGSNAIRRVKADFNGDSRSDALWRNSSSGENYLWPMDGNMILAGEGYLRTVAVFDWQIVGRGDFNGDGRSDILWRNSATGENYIYFMDGTTIKPSEGYIRTVADQNWQVAGIGDFNGDGKDDILWRNSDTGENYIYFMDGLTIATEGYLRTVADPMWQIKGVGDFDADGRADILWRNSATGENYLYFMNGVSIVSEGYLRTVAVLDWKIAGTGDFNGDGRADILWRNSLSGENYLYLMQGTSIAGEGYLRTVADLLWQIAATGDFDGDGKSDVFWRNASTGDNYLYPMDGATIKPSEGYLRSVPVGQWMVFGE